MMQAKLLAPLTFPWHWNFFFKLSTTKDSANDYLLEGAVVLSFSLHFVFY